MGRPGRFSRWRCGALSLRASARAVRAAALVGVTAAVGLGLSGAASFASGPALTVTPISWTVVGLDSNAPSNASLPHVFPVGARICNTGTDPATNVSAKWTWGDTTGTNSIDQAFNGPAQNTAQTVGTVAGSSCRDIYFNVDVKQSGGNSSKTHSQNQNVIVTADGGLSVTETKLIYVEGLVSQNRNTVKGWTGPGGCNLTFTICDPAPTHVYVGQQYTFKLYAQTATAYDELEAFATWPSFITLNSATSTYSTISSPGSSTSSSIWADSCTWGSMTSSSSGACATAGKAGGKTVVTYKVTPASAGTATAIQPMIYDHSGSSFHYNSGFTTSLEAVEADWKLSATVVGDGTVTSSPNGFTSTGASAAISCGTSGTTCDVGYANSTSVTLTAAPGSGQTFTGWSGGSCSGTATTCVVTMTQARSVTATFTGTTHYPLVTTKYGSGTVTAGDSSISCGSTCSASYASGTSVTLTAAASTGWKFTGWSGDCASSGTSPTCTVTMSQARSVTATFDEQTYTLTVSATGTGAGDLCSNNSSQSNAGLCSPGSEPVFISCGSSTSTTNYTDTICTGTYPAGQSVTLYPMCNGGSAGTPCPGGSGASTVTFGGYTGGTCTGSATSGCAFTMDQDRAVNANFVLGNTATPDLTVSKSHVGSFSQGDTGKTYSLTVSNVGTGAGYTGKTITVTDAPPTGLTITALTGTGWTCTIATKSCTQTLGSNIAAGGSLNPITVTVSVASNASTPLVNAATVACTSSCTNDASNDTASDSTTILTPADLTLTKSHSGSFTQGATGDWTLAATNSGGQATSAAVTVTDALPSGFTKNTVTGTGWDCSASTSTNVSCTRTDALAAGSSYPAITVTANVGATAVTSTNTANVSGGGETNTSNDSASDPTTVLAHLTVATAGNGPGTVTDDLGSINCGSTCAADYTTNTVVTLTAAPGTGSTFTTWSGDIGSCTATATTCQVTMSQARSITATFTLQTFTLQVTTSGAGTGTVTSDVGGISCTSNAGTCSAIYNYGTIVTLSQSAGGGSTFAGWSGACNVSGATCVATMTQARSVGAAFDLGTSPFLSVSKSHTGSFRQGDTGDQYTIAVSNTGTAATSGLVTVTDTVPSGLTPTAATGTGWACSVSGQSVTCTRTDALAASGAYPSITVNVDVSATAASSVTNSASVSGGGCSSSPCSSTTDPTTIVQNPRLTVTKTHAGNFSQSDPNDAYTIGVSNGSGAEVGPTSGTVTVSDTLPAGLTPTGAAGAGWSTCSVSGQVVTCSRSDLLARGASYPDITVSVAVAADAPASVTNTASVSGGGCTSSPCGTASDPTTIAQNARLSITKTHSGTFHQGETGDFYTLTVSNATGAEVGATNGTVTVTDTVPAGLTPTSAAGSGWTCPVSGQTVTCTRSDVLPSGSAYPSITVVVDVAASASSSLTNSASVSGGGCASAPCGSASDPTTIVQDPRLSITKTHSGSFHQGDTGDPYAITVSNGSGTEVGPTTGTVTVSDTVPTGLTPTAATGTGWTCSVSGQVVTCSRSDVLARGGSYPAVTVSVDVSATAASSVTNTASVSGGGCTASPCDTASDPTTVVQDPRLAISKSHTGNFHQGDTGDQYSIAVSNGSGTEVGPTSGTVTVGDTVPSGLTPTAATGTGWTCSVSGQVVSCTRSDVLARGASYQAITVTVDVAADALSSITNSASVSGGGCIASPCAGSSDPTTIVQHPRLSLTKTHTGSFHQRDTGDAYTITVSNGSGTEVGPTTGTVTVSDTVPTGLTPTAATGTGWTCSVSGQVVSCTRSDVLARGGSYPAITVTVDVAVDALASITNSAAVSGGGCVAPCGSASDPTTVVQDPRLSITKTHSGSFRQGDSGDAYAITVSNGSGAEVGPTTGTVTVSDTVPTGLTPTAAAGTGWTCSVSGQVVTCARTDVLARGGSYPAITVTVDVAAAAPASITNSASVSGGGCTASPCGTASDPTTVIQNPRLSVTKTHSGSFHQRDTGDAYTITVSNGSGTEVGPTTGTVTVSDTVPTGLTPTAATGTGWTCSVSGQVVTCVRTDVLARGGSYPAITVAVDVAVDALASITNSAAVSGGGCVAPCGSASDPTTVVQDPRLAVTKSHVGSFHQRDTGDQYSITVANGSGTEVGPTTGTVTVSDTVPAGLTPTGAAGTGWSCSVSGQVVTCTRTDVLARGAAYPAITASVDVAVDAPASITNSANVSGGGCVAPCGAASDPTTIVQDPRLAVTKTHNGSFRQRETGDAYTITVTNGSGTEVGPTTGTATVTDTVPAGMTPTGAGGTGWTCSISGQAVTCTRSDVLGRGSSYPTISVSVDIASSAPASLTNSASVSGGGCVAPCGSTTDPTTIIARYDLSVSKSGTGSGTVSSDVGTIGCGSTCVNTFDDGTPVTLTANAASGSTFLGWSGDCTGTSSTCQVTMSQARSVSAAFGRANLDLTKVAVDTLHQGDTGKRFTISVKNVGDGATTSTVTVTESPPAGLTVTGLSGTGWTCSVPALTCTRSDALAAGSSYPDITVVVSVAVNADPAVTNSATVEGGGCSASPCDVSTAPAPVDQTGGSVSGRVFEDKPGSPGLQGWTIFVDRNDNGTLDAGEQSATTNANGDYSISGLAGGVYRVREVANGAAWTCSQPTPCSYARTISPGGSSSGNDFANWLPGSVSGTVSDDSTGHAALADWLVYLDLNGNGAPDPGEPAATTGADGGYTFSSLARGRYTVREATPNGWTCSVPQPCAHDATIESGSILTGRDFGNTQPRGSASATGAVYNDLNADGTRQGGEPGLQGWRVFVDLNGNGRLDAGDLSAKTGADGTYSLSGISPGTYTTFEVIPEAGWRCSDPSPCSRSVTFSAASSVGGLDFGDWAHALLRGHKYEDANRDGVHQAGESPLGGWTIYVDYNDNGVLDSGEPSSLTLPNGYYGITGIAAGTWSVREVGQSDWTCSAPAGCAHRITFTPDSEVDGKDFLNWAPARVTGHVWDDLAADNVRDAEDPPLAGWIVYVDYNGNGKLDAGDISTVTDARGIYSMGVKPGTWTTREIRPEHWICNFPTPCAQTSTFISGSVRSADFGNYRLALLSGTMFNDLNRDGGQDTGEPGLGGWRVYVDYNNNGKWDRGEPFDLTAGGVSGFRTLSSAHGVPGHYTITGIEPGNWPIREIRKTGFPCTKPFSCEYTQRFLEDSRITHEDFATFKPLVTGHATLAVPDMCVADTFTLRVTGSAIQRVDLSIAPGKHRSLRGRGLKQETLATLVDAAAMGVGPHRVFADVFFTKASGTASKRLSGLFYKCAPVAPPFTG